MILIEGGYQANDPAVQPAKARVMECLPHLGHKIVEFSDVEKLEEYLEAGLDELQAAGYPRGLRRMVLIFRSHAAVAAVAKRMLPGAELVAWPDPDAWLNLDKDIDKLKARARRAGARIGD
jgi:hypothetical protein